jgi:hypothetical protein
LRTLDESILLTDKEGVQIYRSPWKESIGHTFSFRDYFHGQGREYGPRDAPENLSPRKQPGVSLAFRSTVTGQYMVAIAVPIRAAENSDVIGVLARTIHLCDLLSQWESRVGGAEVDGSQPLGDRLLSLVDLREQPPLMLDHHWMQSRAGVHREQDAAVKDILRLTPQEELTLRRALRSGAAIEDYRDPLADVEPAYAGQWLAAVAKTADIDWMAIVQERRSDAVKPMQDLYWIFLQYGLLLILVFGAMLTLLWWLIQRAAEA